MNEGGKIQLGILSLETHLDNKENMQKKKKKKFFIDSVSTFFLTRIYAWNAYIIYQDMMRDVWEKSK